jgi:cytochrome c oxidase subunit 2
MFAVAGVATVIGIVLVLAIDWMPDQGDTAARDIDRLYDVLLIFSVPVFVLVMAVAIYSVVRFRARPGEMGDGAPIHGNTRLEVFWVSIPFLIVSGLAVYGGFVLHDIEKSKPGEMRVDVTGQQFAWSFKYEQNGKQVETNELVLPKDKPVVFKVHSKDVLHSFWVPEFRLKLDAVPGITGTVRLTPNKIGNWQVVCTELCGLGHSTMRQPARVVDEKTFTAWLDEKAGGGATAQAGGGTTGGGGATATVDAKAVFSDQGCGGCHTFKAAGGAGTVGPNLDDLAAAAPKREPGKSADDYVHQSIEDPGAFVVKGFPADTMPTDYKTKLKPEEIDALVKYLLSGGKEGG